MKETPKNVVEVNTNKNAEVEVEVVKKRGRKSGTKACNPDNRLLKKTATAATNIHIKDHRAILNKIFGYLKDNKIDIVLRADFESELNTLTHEYEEQLKALEAKLQFLTMISSMDVSQREMLKKYIN